MIVWINLFPWWAIQLSCGLCSVRWDCCDLCSDPDDRLTPKPVLARCFFIWIWVWIEMLDFHIKILSIFFHCFITYFSFLYEHLMLVILLNIFLFIFLWTNAFFFPFLLIGHQKKFLQQKVLSQLYLLIWILLPLLRYSILYHGSMHVFMFECIYLDISIILIYCSTLCGSLVLRLNFSGYYESLDPFSLFKF